MAQNSNHSADMAGNSHRGNTRSSPDSRTLRTQFRLKPEHQNAGRERKRIPLPPMQSREVFSSSLFYLPIIRRKLRQKASRSSSSGRDRRTSKRQLCLFLTDGALNVLMNVKPRLPRFEHQAGLTNR
jgi:hypothetical protein